MANFRKKYGMIVILDALGASQYSEEKIKKFLSARAYLNDIIEYQVSVFEKNRPKNLKPLTPVTFTFGDTLIVACELRSKKHIEQHINTLLLVLQNYLYHSMEEGILFRGAFSIGSFIDDTSSNTVMGEAVTDAASWYEKADWIGLASTPKTNNVMDFHLKERVIIGNPLFCLSYPVPMKDGRLIDLYTISWPGRFFQDNEEKPKEYFLELMKDQPIPLGTESKHINGKDYFYYVEKLIKANTT